MRIKRMTALAMAVAAVAMMNTPAAQAATAAPAAPAAAAPDGQLHAYYGYNLTNHCASWTGNSANWGQCRNQASSLWNNGYPGNLDDVWVYWDINYSGARRGVHNGVALHDLGDWTFDPNTGSGSGQALDNNISSHKWTNL